VIPRNLNVDSLNIGGWRIYPANDGGNPNLKFNYGDRGPAPVSMWAINNGKSILRTTNVWNGYHDINP
jgi:hypothetical protein